MSKKIPFGWCNDNHHELCGVSYTHLDKEVRCICDCHINNC